jgi:hypothetical protein
MIRRYQEGAVDRVEMAIGGRDEPAKLQLAVARERWRGDEINKVHDYHRERNSQPIERMELDNLPYETIQQFLADCLRLSLEEVTPWRMGSIVKPRETSSILDSPWNICSDRMPCIC